MPDAAQKAGDVPERLLCLLTVHIRSACDLRSTSGPETFGNSAIQCGGRQGLAVRRIGMRRSSFHSLFVLPSPFRVMIGLLSLSDWMTSSPFISYSLFQLPSFEGTIPKKKKSHQRNMQGMFNTCLKLMMCFKYLVR